MKRLVTLLFIITGSIGLKGQTLTGSNTNCNFLKGLNFKNGKDTITIKATYEDLIEGAPSPVLDELGKNHELKYDEFGELSPKKGEEMGSSGSIIGFIPEDCSHMYTGVLSRKINYRTFPAKAGTPIYLTCVVFQASKYYYDRLPYFVVINVRRRKLTKNELGVEKADSCKTLVEESETFTPVENGKKYLACLYFTSANGKIYKVRKLHRGNGSEPELPDAGVYSIKYYFKNEDKYEPLTADNFYSDGELIFMDYAKLADKIRKKELKYLDLDKIIDMYKIWKMEKSLSSKNLK